MVIEKAEINLKPDIMHILSLRLMRGVRYSPLRMRRNYPDHVTVRYFSPSVIFFLDTNNDVPHFRQPAWPLPTPDQVELHKRQINS